MRPFTSVTSVVTPLEKVNVDTDQMVPKQFLKLVSRSGFGRYLFYNWRYDGDGNPRDFVLNDPRYDGSKILVTGDNFGCGSSREHAVWALADHGFAVVIAPSFADIFLSNCFKNGVLPISLDPGTVRMLMCVKGEVTVDLAGQTISAGSERIRFEIDPHRKTVLLEGLDEIAQTLRLESKIAEFERSPSAPSAL